MRIAIWMGGVSREREVSLVTGRAVAAALRERGHEVSELDLTDYFEALEQSRDSDAVFIALHGGAGEDGRVQALLELAGIAYVGSGPAASAVAMDKIWSKQLARQLDVLTADWLEISGVSDERLLELAADFGYPLVCKPVDEGSAVGVVLAQNEAEFRTELTELGPRHGRWMLERYIDGREFTAAVVEGECMPLIEIRPKDGFYDYRNKYTEGCTEYDCPAQVETEVAAQMSAAAGRIFDALRLRDMARLDFRLDERGKAFFLEANTIPGMTGTSLLPMGAAAVGMDFGSLCERLCEAAVRRAKSAGPTSQNEEPA
jgi:D-alanine-D-alanine ligase